jgi:hypothetical protein
MPTVEKLEIEFTPRQYNTSNTTVAYRYHDLLTETEFKSLLAYYEQFSVYGVDFDQSVYTYKGKQYYTANQRQFGSHYDRKIFDLTDYTEYYYQTSDTISSWAKETIGTKVHPRIYKILEKFKTLAPFSEDPDKYIALRGLSNVLVYKQLLPIHVDQDPHIYNVPIHLANEYSITIYLNTVSHGGEFWIDGDPGFINKPIPNTAFAFRGAGIYHGVNENLDENKNTRKAITFRFAHIDSLYLPGKPDEFTMANNATLSTS